MLDLTIEELLGIVTGWGQLDMGLGGTTEDGQRATEDTDGLWWHPELALPFGLLSKPVF